MMAECGEVEIVLRSEDQAVSPEIASRDQFYEKAAQTFGTALARLARAYEPDSDRWRDLLQEIHIALWRSFEGFDRRCSLRTWVYRVAHNTAISQVSRRRTYTPTLVGLDELEATPTTGDRELIVDKQRALARVFTLIHSLKPVDRQVILLYLEGMDAVAIGEITGLSQGNIATKIHRIKNILIRRFKERDPNGE
jgi:RNA polymerase sigma-70 factor (ECF subfamily)